MYIYEVYRKKICQWSKWIKRVDSVENIIMQIIYIFYGILFIMIIYCTHYTLYRYTNNIYTNISNVNKYCIHLFSYLFTHSFIQFIHTNKGKILYVYDTNEIVLCILNKRKYVLHRNIFYLWIIHIK